MASPSVRKYEVSFTAKKVRCSLGPPFVLLGCSLCKQEEFSLKIEGQTLDRIYDGFVGQLTGIGNRDSESLQEIIRLKKEIKKLSEKIETMQRQIRREPQLNRQLAMNSEARTMKQQLAEFKKRIRKMVVIEIKIVPLETKTVVIHKKAQ